ncbi:metabolite-proton symporter [Conyzicola lurida]|uniref:Putative proline/betaine transporter n=1 Tax=Conyzicola lurida TaxID=1172621 RepID=A0A841AL47_9MICO|nr:metabolite-proton symporter [Conyzicola lurida]
MADSATLDTPDTVPVRTPEQRREARKVAVSSLIGTSIEWYDYYLYGTAAALIFPAIFFSEDDPGVGVIKAFVTYAVGFAARPLGGFIFGHYGDRVGRKAMLMISLVLMGAATFLIGLLPGYAEIGIWAPILLCVLRLLQGFAVGGEWGSAVVMSVEHAPKNKRGLFGSFPQIGVPVGLLLSSAVFGIVNGVTTDEQFLAWGWRIPFLLSAVLVIVGIVIRLVITESPLFQELQKNDELAEQPTREVIVKHWRTLLLTIGMKLFQNAIFYLYSVFLLSYIANTMQLDNQIGLNAIIISSLIGFVSVPGWSYLTDKIGRKPVYLAGTVLGVIFYPISFVMVGTGNVVFITIAMIIGLNLLHDMIYGPQAVYFSELFGTRVRLSGASIAYQIGAMLSGGLAPLIAAALLVAQNGETWGIVIYAVGLGVISIVCTILSPETFRGTLRDRV